jgi:AmpE protein
MEFVALLICLSIERWTVFGKRVRIFNLLERYIALIKWIFKKWPLKGYLGVFIVLLPIVTFVGIIYFALFKVYYGVLAFLFSVIVLLYCLGSFDFHKVIESMDVSDKSNRKKYIAAIYMQGNRNIFAVIFWYALLGPIGAVLYRVNSLLICHSEMDGTKHAAEIIEQLLEWMPVRLMALSSALVSHFVEVINCWLKYVLTGLKGNMAILAECGFVAFGVDKNSEQDEIENVSNKVINLIDRALALWLVIIALAILL